MKIFKSILLILLIVVIAGAVTYIRMALPIITGYGAKNLCSCVFVSKRNPEAVINEDLNFSFVKYGDYKVNYEDNSASGSLLGLAKRKAYYRDGYGCTLVTENNEEALRSQHLPDISPLRVTGFTWLKSDNTDVDTIALKNVMDLAFMDSTYGHGSGTRGIVIVKDSQLVMEKYRPPFTAETPQLGWSMTKSITNGLVGIMVKNGYMALSDRNLFDFWDDERKYISIDDLLRMSSGLEWEEFYGGVSSATTMLYKSENTGLYAAQQNLESMPGDSWYYSSGTTNILSLLIKHKYSPSDYLIFPHHELFSKLNMTSAVLEPDESGTYIGSSYMYATPGDWAKYGQLILNGGIWGNEQLFPEGWVAYSSRLTEGSDGEYGAHFWLNKGKKRLPDVTEDIIIMSGFQGQRVFILPGENMVIVRMGLDPNEDFEFNLFLRDLLEVINKKEPAEDQQALDD